MMKVRSWPGSVLRPRYACDRPGSEYRPRPPLGPDTKLILDVFLPRGILELGAGKFSTPLFYRYGKKVVTVETDARWIGEVAAMLPARNGFSLIHHDVRPLTSRTRADAIPMPTKRDSVNYYRAIIRRHPDLDLLFIDHLSGLRAFTLCSLFDQFNYVVYHDAEDKGYGFADFSRFDNGNYLHLVLRSYVPHTGILIRKQFSSKLDEFKTALDRNALAYFTDQYRFELQDLTQSRQRQAI